MGRGDLPIFTQDNKMVAMLQSGWAKILNPIIKQSHQKAAVGAAQTSNAAVAVSADGSTPVMIPFNAIQGDIDGSFSGAGGFTAKHNGLFLIGGNVNINNAGVFGTSDFLHVQVHLNGKPLPWQRDYGKGNTTQLGLHMATPVSMQATDNLSIFACTTLAASTYDPSTSLYILRMG